MNFLRKLFGRKASIRYEFERPHIARLVQHPLRCRLCSEPLCHDDEVVWFEKSDWKSALSHAWCTVFIRHEDGIITRINMLTPCDLPVPGADAGTMLLTPDEWLRWRNGSPGSTVER